MKIKTFHLIIVFFIVLVSSCDHIVQLRFDNKSKRDLYVTIYWGQCSDTLLLSREKIGSEIKPNTSSLYDYDCTSWDKWFKNLPCDTVRVYILDLDTLSVYDWDDICSNNRILQRYDLTFQNLKEMDFILYYPPTSAMRDMKMWPSYWASRE